MSETLGKLQFLLRWFLLPLDFLAAQLVPHIDGNLPRWGAYRVPSAVLKSFACAISHNPPNYLWIKYHLQMAKLKLGDTKIAKGPTARKLWSWELNTTRNTF